MLKYRFIILLASILSIVGLFSLPRFVVDNDMENPNEDNITPATEDLGNLNGSLQEVDIPDDILTELNRLKNNLNKSPDDLVGIYADSISAIYINLNRYDSASKYKEMVLLADTTETRILEAADLYYEACNYSLDRNKAATYGEKARFYYEMVLKKDPDRLELKNKVAMTYISSSNPMKGITLLREILDVDPDNEDAIFNIGLLAMRSGQVDKAIDRFEQLIRINPRNQQAHFYLALGYFESGNKEKAREHFLLVKSMGSDQVLLAAVDGYLKEIN